MCPKNRVRYTDKRMDYRFEVFRKRYDECGVFGAVQIDIHQTRRWISLDRRIDTV